MAMNTSIPRPEHPSPQCKREAWINLNGTWEFQKDPGVSGKARRLYESGEFSDRITVPFCMESPLSGIGDTDFCSCVWYRRTLEIPEEWKQNDHRVILHVGACDYRTEVYVNGRRVGFPHRGGYVGFSYDITDFLADGENILVISAEDDLRSREQPSGKQSHRYGSYGCFYTRTTGIWQTVWLECVPADYIEEFEFLCNVEDRSLTVSARLSGGAGKTLRAEAFWQETRVGVAEAVATNRLCTVTVPLSKLHLWEIGKGGLYDLVLTFGDDRVQTYFGMRTLSLDDQALVINGKKIFQRTVLDQGFYPDGIYTAPTEQDLIDDITRSMACGFHGARLHQKVFEPLFLYHCDRLGYIVWDELGNWGLDVNKPAAWKAYLGEWEAVVRRDRNHPSVIGWCPFNETPFDNQDDELLAEVAEFTRRLDPTRPVIETSGWTHVEGAYDILDWHDYDQNPETFRQRYVDVANGIPLPAENNYRRERRLRFPHFPRFISEYGGIKWIIDPAIRADAWGYGEAPQTEEEFIERFRGLAEALMFNPYITGLCYTQLTDVEQETNGLYTYDRRAKFDPAIFREILSQKAAIEEE